MLLYIISRLRWCPFSLKFEPLQVSNIIFITFKDYLTIVAPLSDMMGIIDSYCTGYSRHGSI